MNVFVYYAKIYCCNGLSYTSLSTYLYKAWHNRNTENQAHSMENLECKYE